MIVPILLLLLGLVLLVFGAGWLVDGASSLAKKYRIPDLAIGLTIVAFGTSAPELVVNFFASLQQHQDIVFGNVIGSNNFNLFLILGLAGIITPLTVQANTVWKEIPWSFLAIVLLFILVIIPDSSGKLMLSRLDGTLLFAVFLLFLFYVYNQLRSDTSAPVVVAKIYPSWRIWVMIIVGLGMLVTGGQFVVTQAVKLASAMGVSEKVIGLTIIAAGTSLPELATSVMAAIKKNNDIAVGNIIGSNIFNIFLILSVSAFARPIEYSARFNTDIFLLAGGTLFLFLAMFTGKKKKLDRWEAVLLVVVFVGYTIYMVGKEV